MKRHETDEFKWSMFLWSHVAKNAKNKREFLNWLASEGYMYTPDGPVPIPPVRRPQKRNPVTNPIIGDTP